MHAVLQTKLHRPVPRGDAVRRESLFTRLDAVLEYPVVLVSAPAGYGKTTLIAHWLTAQPELAAVWLSLDTDDNDAARFFAHLITGLSPYMPESDATLLNLLAQSAPLNVIVASLLNALVALDEPLLIVLDDYHVIEQRTIQDALQQLIDRLPPQLHVVLLTRADPPLALARLRARNALLEIRMHDLRFDTEEARRFFMLTTGKQFEGEQIAQIVHKSEGWAAALQLAALTLQRHADVNAFVESLSGAQRYIVDYLIDEVLAHLPEHTRQFLLQTAVLSRMCAPLCDALTGCDDSQTMLEDLERMNMFLVPLDVERQWYRYHHLFAQFLRNRLGADGARQQHEKAARWFASHDLIAEAIPHALDAADFALAGDLMEMVVRPMFAQANLNTLHRWYSALPDATLNADPRLQLSYALILHSIGSNEAALHQLTRVEKNAHLVPEDHQQHFQASVATIHALIASHTLRVDDTLVWAERALQLLPEDDCYTLAGVHYARGIIWSSVADNPTAALRDFDETIRCGLQAGHFLLVSSALNKKGNVLRTMGRINEAIQVYQQALDRLYHLPIPAKLVVYEGLAMAYYSQNKLVEAAAIFETYQLMEHIVQIEMPRVRLSVMIAYMTLLVAQEKWEAAEVVNQQIRTLAAAQSDSMFQRIVRAQQAWFALVTGELDPAEAWAQSYATETSLMTRRQRDFWHETLIFLQIQLAGEHFSEALEMMQSLLADLQENGRIGHHRELSGLQALALAQTGQREDALHLLANTIESAQPEHDIMPFLQAGRALQPLLVDLRPKYASNRTIHTFIGDILSAFKTSVSPYAKPMIGIDIEPLTERETEILHLIELGMTNKVIAERLVISVATVKKHISNIFLKLDAQNRTQALSRAREYNLLQ